MSPADQHTPETLDSVETTSAPETPSAPENPSAPETPGSPGNPPASDMAWVGETLTRLVPFVDTLGIEFRETSLERCVVHLPARPDTSNHLGGPHAGAIFTAAETASGAVTLAAFGAPSAEATPVVARASMEFVKFASSDVVATGHLVGDRDAALAALAAGERPEFDVEVECFCGDRLVTRATITWTLIRPR